MKRALLGLVLLSLAAYSLIALPSVHSINSVNPSLIIQTDKEFQIAIANALAPVNGLASCRSSPLGDDTSGDGHSWESAKKSQMACYDQLPQQGGVILVMDIPGVPSQVCKATDPVGCGYWIMSSRDPNYSNPPPGWRKSKGAVYFIGVGGSVSSAFATGPQVLLGGGGTGLNQPLFWLSGIYGHAFVNFAGGYPRHFMRLGIDSNGNRSNFNTGSWNNYFGNVGARVNGSVGYGPTIEVGSNSGWNHFISCQIAGNPAETVKITSCTRVSGLSTCTVAALPSSYTGSMNIGVAGASDALFNGLFKATIISPTQFTYSQYLTNSNSTGGYASSDAAQAILVNSLGTANPGAGLLDLENTFFGTTGIRAYAGSSGFSAYVTDSLQEGGLSPVFNLSGCGTPTSNFGGSLVMSIQVADNPANPLPGVRVDNVNINCPQSSVGVAMASADGPITNLGGAGPSNSNVLPSVMGQYGIYQGRVFAQDDTARRGFSPVATRFPNLAGQDAIAWSGSPTGSITINQSSSPDGNTLAGTVSSTSSASTVSFASGQTNLTVGMNIVYGVWARSTNGNGFHGAVPVQFSVTNATLGNGGSYLARFVTLIPGSGEWTYYTGSTSIIHSSGNNSYSLFGNIDSSHPADYFAPVLNIIPAGMTANELAEYTSHLQSYRTDSVPGQVSLLKGQQFKADSIQIGSGLGSPTITSGSGVPTGLALPGSIYLRQDTSQLYVYTNGQWVVKF